VCGKNRITDDAIHKDFEKDTVKNPLCIKSSRPITTAISAFPLHAKAHDHIALKASTPLGFICTPSHNIPIMDARKVSTRNYSMELFIKGIIYCIHYLNMSMNVFNSDVIEPLAEPGAIPMGRSMSMISTILSDKGEWLKA
jgi:hypothetical protein